MGDLESPTSFVTRAAFKQKNELQPTSNPFFIYLLPPPHAHSYNNINLLSHPGGHG